jgi:hypothetical protein
MNEANLASVAFHIARGTPDIAKREARVGNLAGPTPGIAIISTIAMPLCANKTQLLK